MKALGAPGGRSAGGCSLRPLALPRRAGACYATPPPGPLPSTCAEASVMDPRKGRRALVRAAGVALGLLALALLLPLAGCEDPERRDLERQRNQLADQRRQVEQAAQQLSASKTPLTKQDQDQLQALN